MSGSAPSSSALQTGSRNPRWLGYDRTSKLWLAYAAMGILLLAYLGWLISGSHSTLIDGWGVSGFELVGGALCIASGLVRREARWVPIILGAALMAWAFGHLTETIETLGGATPPEAALYDAFQLCFYPLAYVAIVLYLRGEVRRLATPNWLDGIVAGLGAAASCVRRPRSTRSRSSTGKYALATAVNLAYPVGDLLLLLLVVGGAPSSPGETGGPGCVIASGIALNVGRGHVQPVAVRGQSLARRRRARWNRMAGCDLSHVQRRCGCRACSPIRVRSESRQASCCRAWPRQCGS